MCVQSTLGIEHMASLRLIRSCTTELHTQPIIISLKSIEGLLSFFFQVALYILEGLSILPVGHMCPRTAKLT